MKIELFEVFELIFEKLFEISGGFGRFGAVFRHIRRFSADTWHIEIGVDTDTDTQKTGVSVDTMTLTPGVSTSLPPSYAHIWNPWGHAHKIGYITMGGADPHAPRTRPKV